MLFYATPAAVDRASSYGESKGHLGTSKEFLEKQTRLTLSPMRSYRSFWTFTQNISNVGLFERQRRSSWLYIRGLPSRR